MKNIIILLFIFVTNCLYGQIDTIKTSSHKGFDVESGTITSIEVEVQEKKFPVYQTKAGAFYVKAVGKSGNNYPVWIGKPANKDVFYNGGIYPARVSSSGKIFILVLGTNGYPRAVYSTE